MNGLRVLGVDCGSIQTGVAVLQSNGKDHQVLHFGAIRVPRSRALGDRLKQIHQELEVLLERFRPDSIALEEVFQAFNVKSAMHMIQVRGVVLLLAAQTGLPVSEYSALAVKKSVVGYGRAEKHQVQRMVQRILALAAPPQPEDAADALAVALCHIHNETTRRRLAGSR